MEPIADLIVKALAGCTTGKPSSDRMRALAETINANSQLSDEERHARQVEATRRKAEEYNRTPGNLRDGYYTSTIDSERAYVDGDGYDCPLCLNRGNIMRYADTGDGVNEWCEPCACMKVRRSILRMRASGLEKSIREQTFRTFEAREPWQQAMVDSARKYLAEGVEDGRWLYVGGQVGCGKTHICTAIAGKLLLQRPVMYVVWPQISKKIKALSMDAEEYEREVGRLQRIEVLYIDDLFKPVPDERTGEKKAPTGADIRIAFEILNYRYINRLPTILSSEWHLAELADMDDATASRIAERCGEYAIAIGRDRGRNHRYMGGTAI